jgi:hypothetical protein
MNAYQNELLSQVKFFLADSPKNTHQIARLRGDYQAYESNLRDRLFRLADRGLLTVNNTARGRFWSLP